MGAYRFTIFGLLKVNTGFVLGDILMCVDRVGRFCYQKYGLCSSLQIHGSKLYIHMYKSVWGWEPIYINRFAILRHSFPHKFLDFSCIFSYGGPSIHNFPVIALTNDRQPRRLADAPEDAHKIPQFNMLSLAGAMWVPPFRAVPEKPQASFAQPLGSRNWPCIALYTLLLPGSF